MILTSEGNLLKQYHRISLYLSKGMHLCDTLQLTTLLQHSNIFTGLAIPHLKTEDNSSISCMPRRTSHSASEDWRYLKICCMPTSRLQSPSKPARSIKVQRPASYCYEIHEMSKGTGTHFIIRNVFECSWIQIITIKLSDLYNGNT